MIGGVVQSLLCVQHTDSILICKQLNNVIRNNMPWTGGHVIANSIVPMAMGRDPGVFFFF